MGATPRNRAITEGPIAPGVLKFALPVAATAILSQLFNAADLAVVGNFSLHDSTTAVAAVGANSPVVGLVVSLFLGISLGATVVIANAVGREDQATVDAAVHSSIVFSLLGGLAVCLLGQFIAEPLLRTLAVPEEVMPRAVLYLRIYLAGMPVILLYNFEAAIFRSVGETKVPLMALAASGLVNVVLNILFVAGLGMSVEGVALATVIANAASAAFLFFRLTRHTGWVRLEPKRLRIDARVLGRILAIGVPSGLQGAVFSISNLVVQSAVNSLGAVVMAGSSAALNIESFSYSTLSSFSQACSTYVGQNNGAGDMARCRKSLACCLVEGGACLAVIIGLLSVFGDELQTLFNDDPEAVGHGMTRLRWMFIAHPFSLLYEVMAGYLRGFGISAIPAAIAMVGVCGTRILWVNFVFPLEPTFNIIMLAYPVSLSLTALLMFIALLWRRPSIKRAKEK